MDISILAVGRMKDCPERRLVDDYLKRIARAGRPVGLAVPSIIELSESPARDAAARRTAEGQEIEARRPAGATTIILDETGDQIDSAAFAALIARVRDEGRGPIAIVIGGPDGIDPSVRQRADRVLAFGRMTWPHRLVRVMLAEQLYRAVTILTNHPYHRV